MPAGRPLQNERAAQQVRALQYFYQAETKALGTGTSLTALAGHLGGSDDDANETLVGLLHRGQVVRDSSSGEYRLTESGRLEAARLFTFFPPSSRQEPSSRHEDVAARVAENTTRPPNVSPDGQATVVAPRPPVELDDNEPTMVVRDRAGGDATIVSDQATDDETAGPLRVGARFGNRYRITRVLGVGGMGAVYEAWDGELGVSVALKVIRPEIAGDSNAARELERRFKRELLLARQVTHKNVVRIHDLGEIDGIKYITMPYIEGDDLRSILKAEKRLPVPRALAILRQALSGLVAAHAAGIVHRDLKPANIMVDTEGQALLMDFGIARSIGVPAEEIRKGRSRSEPGSYGETMVGAVVGTILYMAPEQAKGQAVDHRADIYAFGLILRDTLLGLDRQQSAPTALAELQKRLDAAPASLRSIDATIPEPLDRIVTKCLAPDLADRYQTTAELEADLNRLDENGELIPIKRVVRLPLVAAMVSLLLALAGGSWWYARSKIPPAAHDPVSVLIADLQNNTGDPTLDRTLEPTLKRALETASFVSAYDRAGISSAVGVRPPERLDDLAARELAVKQGLNVVLSGSVDRQGNGYGISIKVTQTVTGKVIADVKNRASNKDQLLGAATKLMAAVRKALGDDTSDSARQFAMVTMSTTSLDVVRHHAAAMEAMSNNKFEEGLQSFQKAVELDPKFGIGYQGKAAMLLNLGKRQEAEQNLKEALTHLDGMTERERYNTRGLYYALVGDYQACVKEFGDMVSRYPASPDAHMSRASCLTYLRELPKAVDGMRQAVAILPKRALYRTALALYAGYASNFQAAEREARTIQEPDPFSVLALAFGQLGQGQLPQAIETYQKVGKIGVLGASLASSGLGDVALYEGRFSDAIRILSDGAAADLAAMNAGRAAAKFTSVAYAQLSRGQIGPAVNAVKKALVNSQEVKIRLLAARVLVEAGEIVEARKLAVGLAKEAQAEPQAYAKIVEGEILLKNKDPQQAIKLLGDANRLLDVWLGHFDLGRAYLQAGQPLQADSEFDRCLNRRGEVMALFLDEEPTYGYFPSVYYYRGLAREGMKTEGFRESYREYLKIRGNSTEDALVREIRRRIDQ